jgi:hypothetical protein
LVTLRVALVKLGQTGLDGAWHMEHVIPIVKGEERGGNNDLGNMLPACIACNYKKFNYGLLTFAQRNNVELKTALLNVNVNTMAKNEIRRGMGAKRSFIPLDPDAKALPSVEVEVEEIMPRYLLTLTSFTQTLSNSVRVITANYSTKPDDIKEVPIVEISNYWATEAERKSSI